MNAPEARNAKSAENTKERTSGVHDAGAKLRSSIAGRLSALKLRTKIPAIIIGAALISAVVVGILSTNRASHALRVEAEKKFQALVEAKKNSLSDYLEFIRQDLRIISGNATVRAALADFRRGWQDIGINPTQKLQRLYIEDNPHPTGKKDDLDFANDGSIYSRAHAQYHPWIRSFLREHGYYDIFLFDPDGNLVYTVFKELDYATNLRRGQWKDTDLGNAFRAARSSGVAGEHFFFDFKPYAPSHGAPASFISTPIVDDRGTLEGVLVFQMPIDRLNATMQQTAGMGETGETFIFGIDSLMRSDSRFAAESTILAKSVDTEAAKRALAGEQGVLVGTDASRGEVLSAYDYIDFLGTRWGLASEASTDEVFGPIRSMVKFNVLFGLLTLVGVSVLGFLFARTIVRPMSALSTVTTEIAEGNKSADVPARVRQDELGDMARAVEIFKANAIKMEQLAAEQLEAERQAAEDREKAQQERETARIQREHEMKETEEAAEAERKAALTAMANSFEQAVMGVVSGVGDSAKELEVTAKAMNQTVDVTNEQALSASSATEQASTNVQTVASAAEQLAASIQEITRQVNQSADNSRAATGLAERTNETVGALSEATQRIGEVVTLINDIASQTNLLALNATIEAARAGDAGKGFSVVAAEVKELASQTAKATDEISQQITAIQQTSSGAVDAIGEIATAIAGINDLATGIAAAVEEQAAATNEISRNVQEAASGTSVVSSNISQVSNAVGETGSAAQSVLTAAGDLTTKSENLRREVDAFLRDVRAA